MLLRPDFTFYLKGIRVRRYDLTQHNPNAIPMPTAAMDRDSIVGSTIHNTNHRFTAWEQRSSASGKRCTKN